MKLANERMVVVALIAALVVVGFLGIRYIDQDNKIDNSFTAPSEPTPGEDEYVEDMTIRGDSEITVLETPITISSVDDIEKLPPEATQMFREFIQEELSNNPDSNNCKKSYEITRINNLNVEGTAILTPGAEVSTTETCQDPVHRVWFKADNEWEYVDFNPEPSCDDFGPHVYTEFVQTCFSEEENRSILNPNGSLSIL